MKRKFSKAAVSKTTLLEAFNDYILEKKATGRSDSTIRNYETSYKLFVEYHELNNSFLLDDLTEKMFYQWRQDMIEREVRPQSINHYIRDWRTFLNWCAFRDIIEEPIKLKEMKAQEDKPKMYSDDEMTKMITKPRDGDSYTIWRDWAIISLVYSTGLRASSICSLTIGCLDFKRGYISIPQQKNKKFGMLPITQALERVLKEYLNKWLKNEPQEAYLFQTVTGEQFTVNALYNSIERYCKRYGIKAHGIHSVRHNFTRQMLVNGANEIVIKEYLQHSSLEMTQHYVKLFASDLKRDAESYNPLDTAKKKQSRTSKFKKGN